MNFYALYESTKQVFFESNFDKYNGTLVRVEDGYQYENEPPLGGKIGKIVGTSDMYNGTWKIQIDDTVFEIHDTYLKDLFGNYLKGLP